MNKTLNWWRRPRSAAVLHATVAVLGLCAGWWVALTFRPVPVSDFAHYWTAASDLTAYAKGGIWILVLRPLKELGLSPHVAAALIHGAAWLGLAWVLWDSRAHRNAQALATLALLAVGLWWCALWGTVAGDVPHVALSAVGARLALDAWRDSTARGLRRHLRFAVAVIVTGFGFSIRMQAIPVAVLVTLVASIAAWRTHRPVASWVALAGVGAIVTALACEHHLRDSSTQNLSLYTRITLYSGLLAAHPGPGCGRWSEEAEAMTSEDLNRPFLSSVRQRLADKWSEVPAIVICKMRMYLLYTEVGVPWLRAGVRARNSLLAYSMSTQVLRLAETIGGRGVELLLIVMFVSGVKRARGRTERPLAISIAATLVGGYLMMHLLLELQPRYLIEPLVFGLVAAHLGFSRALPPLQK